MRDKTCRRFVPRDPRGYTHELQEYTSVSPAGGNVLKRASSNKSGLCYSRGKLGQSKASGEFSANRMQRSNLLSLIFGSTIFCFPKMWKIGRM